MIGIPEHAAKLYAVALALNVAADADEATRREPRDVRLLIAQGRLLVEGLRERGEMVPPGRPTVFYRDAAATFVRAWARHDPGRAAYLVDAAEAIELGRDLAMLTVPRTDA